MYPDEPFAEGRGSFLRPVPPWTKDPGATPSKTVTIPCQYLPYVRGALQQLLLQSTWQTDDPALLLLSQQRAFGLIALFTECDEADVPFACPYDFVEADGHGWTNRDFTPYSPPDLGALSLGFGWVNTCINDAGDAIWLNGISIEQTFAPAFTCDRIAVELGYGHGTFSPPYYGLDIEAYHSGGLVGQLLLTDTATPVGDTIQELVLGSALVDHIIVQTYCAKSSVSTCDGFCRISTLSLYGSGASPCGAE